MLKAFLTAYPWDLIDEGVDAVLDRLHGEVGISGVSVWVASPPVVQLRVRDVGPRVVRSRGGLFFHPDEQPYAATRCKPIVSGWVKGRHPLTRIAEACAERAMDLRVIVSAAMTGRLAQRHAEMACKNVFDAASYSAVCLANPDVQAYLHGLVSDLSAHESVTGVTVRDFEITWPEAFRDDLCGSISLGLTERIFLATCFCESCHQRASAAGVDVAMARRSVQTILQRTLDTGTPADWSADAILADNAPLAEYYRWRSGELSSLLRRLTEMCSCELLLDRHVDRGENELGVRPDYSIPAGVITRLIHPEQSTETLIPDARRIELRLPESFAVGAHGPQLVSTLSQAVELGIAGVEIGNYGLLPDSALTSIKQAIRFARRTATE